jgi:hypothetical protein
MSDEMMNSTPEPTTAAEGYVAKEFSATRATLRNTQIFGTLIVLALSAYLITVTARFSFYMQPKVASDLAIGFMTDQIDTHEDAFLLDISTRVPAMIQQMPDLVIAKLPGYRETIESTFEKSLQDYCQKTRGKLDTNLDDYLSENKESIKTVLAAQQDPDAVKQLGATLREEVMTYLKEDNEGQSITKQINESQSMLEDAAKQMHRLATAKNLTPGEKKTRQAVAIIARTIDQAELKPLALPTMNGGGE